MKTFEPNKEMKEGDYVYVSSESEEHAIKNKNKKILLRKCSDGYVCIFTDWEEEYLKGEAFETTIWDYAVPIPRKTITLEVTEEQEEQINNILKR